MPIADSRPLARASQVVLPTPSVPPVSASPVIPTVPHVPAERSTNALVVHPIGQSSQADVVSPPAPRINISTKRLPPVKLAIPAVQVAPVPDPAPASPAEIQTTRC